MRMHIRNAPVWLLIATLALSCTTRTSSPVKAQRSGRSLADAEVEVVDEPGKVCATLSPQELEAPPVNDPAEAGFVLKEETDHFEFWARPGGTVVDRAPRLSEAHYAGLTKHLGEPPARIRVFVYDDREDLRLSLGLERPKPLIILRQHLQLHMVDSYQLHEYVHLYSYWTGGGHRTVPFIEEGLAEAYGNWSWRPGRPLDDLSIKDQESEHVHTLVARWLARGEVPELRSLLTEKDFRSYSGPHDDKSYYFAASFVKYLIDRYGWGPLRRILREACLESSREDVRAAFERAYSTPITELEDGWRAFLGTRSNTHL